MMLTSVMKSSCTRRYQRKTQDQVGCRIEDITKYNDIIMEPFVSSRSIEVRELAGHSR